MQSLLKLRQQQEDQKKKAVADLLAQIHEYQQHAVQLASGLKQEAQNLKQQYLQGAVDLGWIGHYHRYATYVYQAINQDAQSVAMYQKKLITARSALAEAAKQTKILEKLKDKQKKRYDAKLERKENIELDEIGASAFLRADRQQSVQGNYKV